MGKERDGSNIERRENESEYCVLKFSDGFSSDLSSYAVNPRTKLNKPDEFFKLAQKQDLHKDRRHPLSVEYYNKFVASARSNDGYFGLSDAINILVVDGWEPLFTGKNENHDNFILFKRSK